MFGTLVWRKGTRGLLIIVADVRKAIERSPVMKGIV